MSTKPGAGQIELLANKNNMNVVSRVRRQAVPIYTSGLPIFTSPVMQFFKVNLRPAFRHNSGYYIMRMR